MPLGMNKLILIGVVSEIEPSATASGAKMTKFNLHVVTGYFNRDGEWNSRNDVLPLTIFGKRAETFPDKFNEGDTILVEGRAQSREWKEKLYVDLVVESVAPFEKARTVGAKNAPAHAENTTSVGESTEDADLPF